MSDDDRKVTDILGIKPVGEAISKVTTAAVDGAAAFLSRICLPAAEEYGLLLQDKVRAWRARNALAVIQAAESSVVRQFGAKAVHAHPRLVAMAIENGSWSDEDVIHRMWGGLLATSCSETEADESNLIFMTLLSQLTSSQARVLNYAAEYSEKEIGEHGLVSTHSSLNIDLAKLQEITGVNDVHRLDRELDHLRALGLIHHGFSAVIPQEIDVAPSPLGLNLYVRSQGFVGSPVEYFGLVPKG